MLTLWLLAAATHAATDPAVQHDVIGYLKQLGMIVGTITVLAGTGWWLIKPRFDAWLHRTFIKPLQETHTSVTVNGGKNDPATLMDKVGRLSEDLADARKDVRGIIATQMAASQELGEVRSEVTEAKHIAEEARDTLQHHVASGERYLGQVQIVLKEHGIEIPPGDD